MSSLVTEHLGFAPVSFVDDVINAINTLLYRCMNELEQVVESQLGAGDELDKVPIALILTGNGSC